MVSTFSIGLDTTPSISEKHDMINEVCIMGTDAVITQYGLQVYAIQEQCAIAATDTSLSVSTKEITRRSSSDRLVVPFTIAIDWSHIDTLVLADSCEVMVDTTLSPSIKVKLAKSTLRIRMSQHFRVLTLLIADQSAWINEGDVTVHTDTLVLDTRRHVKVSIMHVRDTVSGNAQSDAHIHLELAPSASNYLAKSQHPIDSRRCTSKDRCIYDDSLSQRLSRQEAITSLARTLQTSISHMVTSPIHSPCYSPTHLLSSNRSSDNSFAHRTLSGTLILN